MTGLGDRNDLGFPLSEFKTFYPQYRSRSTNAPEILQSGRYSLIFSDDSVLRASCNAAGDLVSEIKLRGNSQYFNNIVFGIVAIVAKRNGDNEENYEHICDILAKGEPCRLDSKGVRYQLERDADRSEFTCSLAA